MTTDPPDFIPPHGDDLHLPGVGEAINRTMQSVLQAKAAWLRNVMKRIMPPDIFSLEELAKPGSEEREKIVHWLKKHRVNQREYPDRTAICMGKKVVAEFRVQWQDGQLQCQERIYDFQPKAKNNGNGEHSP